MARRILILSHQLLMCLYFLVHVIKDDLATCQLYCRAAVYVTKSVHELLRVVSKLTGKRQTRCWITCHILQQTRMRSGLLNGHRSGPVEEVLPSRKIVQCRMSSVQGTVNTRPLCIKRVRFFNRIFNINQKLNQ